MFVSGGSEVPGFRGSEVLPEPKKISGSVRNFVCEALDLCGCGGRSFFAGRRSRDSVRHSEQHLCETVFVQNRELIHRLAPMMRWTSPIGRDVAQGEPDQLQRRVVVRKMPARLDDLANVR